MLNEGIIEKLQQKERDQSDLIHFIPRNSSVLITAKKICHLQKEIFAERPSKSLLNVRLE